MGSVVKQSVSRAAAGSERDLLVALRDKIADQIDNEDLYPRDLYALSKQLIDIRAQLDELDAREPENTVSTAVDVPDERWNAG